MIGAPTPTACITPTFSKTGDIYWYNINLKLTNNCGRDVDFQNSSVTFGSGDNLNTSFWGEFGPITYPDNPLLITSQPTGTGGYIASLSLHIPEESWAKSILPNGQSITLQYGAAFASYDQNSVKVYVSGGPVQTGQINLKNTTTKPATISQTYALVNVKFNGQLISSAQVPWLGQFTVANLSPGTFTIEPQTIQDSQGASFQGSAVPTSVNVVANQTATATVSYKKVTTTGSVKIQVAPLPAQLVGYTVNPAAVLTRPDTGASITQSIPWNATTTVSNLESNVTYNFSTPAITYKGYKCAGSFNPQSLVSQSVTIPTTQLSYNCVPIAQDVVTVNVKGLNTATSTVNVKFQPSDGSTAVSKDISLSGGTGSSTITLTDGVVYSVSSTSVAGFGATYSPQPITAQSSSVETVTYQAQTGGRIMAYVPGWKTPPSATSLAAAGYTNMIAAFGVFSTTSPGQIVSAFDSVTKSYIDSLHSVGIKVSLSLGGASTSLPNTSVDFHQVLVSATSPTAFQQAFVASVKTLVSQFGFDGIDIDIEQGFNASGTFAAPTGDIAVLAGILNTLHKDLPNLLISLVPQAANVAATSGFDATWGNYASLIMQTHDALSWVGIQVYNTGCVYGLDQVCYADLPSSPNLSTALAADILENWPATDKTGRATGFQPYISNLRPDQVVLGYPAPNKSGASDGAPVKPTATIKRAIQCLRTGAVGSTGCDSYVPPRAYPGIGGVFEWEITYDQDNNFKFATDLKACVISGTC